MLSAEMPESERITRRDFLNGTLLASGAALVSAACPFQLMAEEDWNGASGVGDYAGANGNTHQVMADGHTIRDHAFERAPNPVEDTGEAYDCVVVGGGISGLAAALFYHRAMSAKGMGAKKSCLVLENHPIFGGEAKRNEFNVDGQRLIASQGSAMWFQPMPGSFLQHFYDSVGIDPRQFQYQRNASAIATGVTPYAGDGSNFGFFSARTLSNRMAGGWSILGRRSWKALRLRLRRSASCWRCEMCRTIAPRRGVMETPLHTSLTRSRSKRT
jgi:spermidine dehydrogenase